jgi:hypothetical protein
MKRARRRKEEEKFIQSENGGKQKLQSEKL